MKKRALISVSDKTNLIRFARDLVMLDFEIVSTGGTKKVLESANIPTIGIEEITQFPEMLDGRVKTLHPNIHGGLLAVRNNETHQQQIKERGIKYIDLVCVNLYPFKETISKKGFTHEQAIENIDIGGPSMIRSAAKNYKFVTVVTDYQDYETVVEEYKKFGDTSLNTKERLSAKAFRLTASYDAAIQAYLTEYVQEESPESVTFSYNSKQKLRYGENPHQEAILYTNDKLDEYGIVNATQLHGKELSYINIQDGHAVLQILQEFSTHKAVVAVKHGNPCGVGISNDITTAYNKAYEADTTSIFGGVVALNDEVNIEIATHMSKMFLEIIIAPSFSKEAYEILSSKKNIRLMTFNPCGNLPKKQLLSVNGGLLIQDIDYRVSTEEMCTCVTEVEPSDEQLEDCLFGEKVVKHVKSNAIIVAKDGQTLGIGAGQMNRVGATKIALEQAREKAKGAILASDAFFPMNDTVALAVEYGISAIIQPGGSIKDQDSIDLCNKHKISMVFTGERHFKH